MRAAIGALAMVFALITGAQAQCLRHVAGLAVAPIAWSLAQVPADHVGVTFAGHSTFLIETAQGVRIATDYNDFTRPRVTPHIVTMNIAHSTHYSRRVESGVERALEGWGTMTQPAHHDVVYRDVRVRNVPTNIRDEFGGTYFNGNSIFVFETVGLCLAHLGHLHHRLRPAHLAQLGEIDILFVPVDGTWTLNQDAMMEVIEQIKAPVVIPMHVFSEASLLRFIAKVLDHKELGYQLRHSRSASVTFARASLPRQRELLVLPER